MARVSATTVTIGALNTIYGLGNSLSAYTRTSTSVKNSTIALAPVGNPISMGRLRGSFPSGTYRNLDILASSTTSGINVFPSNINQAYIAGLSNNSDPANSYTLFNGQATGNYGYATTSNVFRQYYYTAPDTSQTNSMYWRMSNKAVPYAGGFEEQGAWVSAIGFNYWSASVSSYFDTLTYDFFGGGNNYFGYWSPGFYELVDGNNFMAAYVYGGTFYFGMLNRAQLRAGVIQPLYSISLGSATSPWWDNSMLNICQRIRVYSATGSYANLDLYIGWDEYILRGYDLPAEARLYGVGDTGTRDTVINSGSAQYIDGRIFE
jgi:hypothetical protein